MGCGQPRRPRWFTGHAAAAQLPPLHGERLAALRVRGLVLLGLTTTLRTQPIEQAMFSSVPDPANAG
jgi:hypothetical protein